MTDYRAIKGKTVRSVSSDLGAEGEGEIWFNTASSDFKTIVKVAGAWATGGDLNTARSGAGMAGAAPSTGTLIFGGSASPSQQNESYDGSSWTEEADLSTARNWAAGFGATDTAAVCGGGEPASVNAETWNGTSWTEGNNMNTARHSTCGTGPSTVGLISGGKVGDTFQVIVEQYDGTDWTETGDFNTARALHGQTGTTTAGLAFGGASPYTANSESFDGSAWTEGANLNVAKGYIQSSFGSQTLSLAVGGFYTDNRLATTEFWDGVSWTEVGDFATAASGQAGGGSSVSAGVAAGGQTPSVTVNTFEGEWSSTTTGPGAQNIEIITD